MRTPGLKMAAVKIQHKNCLQSTLRKNIINICRPRSVRIGKNFALGLGYAASGRTQDLWQITYIGDIKNRDEFTM